MRKLLSVHFMVVREVFLAIVALAFSPESLSQTFPCDNSFYISQVTGSRTTSTLFKLSRDSMSGNWEKEVLIEDVGYRLGTIGYRVQDKLIYGITYPDLKLVQMKASGEVNELADLISRGFDTTKWEFRVGDIAPAGHIFFVIGHSKETGFAELSCTVRFGPDYRVGCIGFNSPGRMEIDDLAYDPIYGSINSYDRESKALVILSQGGSATNYFSQSSASIGAVSGFMFDKLGQLWGIGRETADGDTDNSLLRFNKFNGEILERESIPSGGFTAACSCPYTVEFEKILPKETSPGCERMDLIYAISNKTGTGQPSITFLDTLPKGFKIAKIRKQPFLTTFSFEEESGALALEFRELVLGQDSLILEVETPAQAFDEWSTQASLEPLPLGLGKKQLSDNPYTDILGDPTRLLYSPLSLTLPEDTFICSGEILTLTPDIQPSSSQLKYLWQTGDTSSAIQVSRSGLYKLSVSNGCKELSDSVWVSSTSFPLSVSLGEDINMQEGKELRLFPVSNSSTSYTVSWEVEEGIELDCSDCPNPIATVSQSANVIVTLTDANGCIATDTLFIEAGKIRDVWMPNVFSPNGDGINDVLYLQGRALAEFRNFRIVDRWGQQIFWREQGQIDQNASGWDGKKGGNTVQSGVYYWSVEVMYPDGSTEARQGFVTLVQ